MAEEIIVIDNEDFNNVITNMNVNDTIIKSIITELGPNNLYITTIVGQLMNDLLKSKFNL